MNQVIIRSRARQIYKSAWEHYPLLAIISLSIWFYMWGIQRNLPYTFEVDEPVFVKPAINMVATGDLNPKWFGHPGSTVIYSLASLYHIWDIIVYDGVLLQANPNIQTRFDNDFSEFYILGRVLSIAFGVLGVFMTFKLGQSVFREKVGLAGAWLALISPFTVSHVRYVRTDGATIFFCVLSLWLCFQLYEHPTIKNRVLAGIGVGLSIATKYYLATLIPVLFVVNVFASRKRETLEPHCFYDQKKWLETGISFIVVGIAFTLSVPYFFLDFATVKESLLVMGHSNHLGHDGLSFSGNLFWYFQTAIPKLISWPQTILAILSIGLLLWQRRLKSFLLLSYVILFLLVLSMHSLHWARWLFPIVPVLTLLAAYSLDTIVFCMGVRWKLGNRVENFIRIAAIVLISIWPTYQVALSGIRQANPNTRILARDWILENLPKNSRIAQESYTAPLAGTDYEVVQYNFLAIKGRVLDDYYREDYQYLMISSSMYNRFLAEPDRFPNEVTLYETLFIQGHLVQLFEPSRTRGGPTVRIYALNKP